MTKLRKFTESNKSLNLWRLLLLTTCLLGVKQSRYTLYKQQRKELLNQSSLVLTVMLSCQGRYFRRYYLKLFRSRNVSMKLYPLLYICPLKKSMKTNKSMLTSIAISNWVKIFTTFRPIMPEITAISGVHYKSNKYPRRALLKLFFSVRINDFLI